MWLDICVCCQSASTACLSSCCCGLLVRNKVTHKPVADSLEHVIFPFILLLDKRKENYILLSCLVRDHDSFEPKSSGVYDFSETNGFILPYTQPYGAFQHAVSEVVTVGSRHVDPHPTCRTSTSSLLSQQRSSLQEVTEL